MYDIVAIGSATRDNFFKVDYELIDWKKAPSGKAFALPYGEKLEVKDVYFTIGGNAANASVTFSRHGFRTAVSAKIGSDIAADELKKTLEENNVATELLVHHESKPTAYSVLLLREGERTILGHHGASDTFILEDVALDKMKAKWWYVSLSGESDVMLIDLVEHARANDIKVAFNPSGHHIKHKKEDILSLLHKIDFLVLNTGEAAELVDISFKEEKAAFEKLDDLLSPGIVAVTDGPGGVTVSDGKTVFKAGIFKEQFVADRTGAGDAFGSGFTAALAAGEGIEEAIRFASANATSVVEHLGATEGTIRKEDYKKSSRWSEFPIKKRKL